jgi:hypothetical protein
MFWTHWNLSALRSLYGLAASGSETGGGGGNTEANKALWVVLAKKCFLFGHFGSLVVFIICFYCFKFYFAVWQQACICFTVGVS